MLMMFWQTIKTLLNTILLRNLKSPFTTAIGLNLDTINAGRSPERTETNTSTMTPAAMVAASGTRTIVVPRRFSIQPLNSRATSTPDSMQTNVNKNDSIRYLQTMLPEDSPRRRLVAISFARFPVCATVRFM